jgi:hypothetical protein
MPVLIVNIDDLHIVVLPVEPEWLEMKHMMSELLVEEPMTKVEPLYRRLSGTKGVST